MHRYPYWEPPEIDDWRYAYPDYPERCFPLAAVLGIGAIGLLASCRPRRYCHPFLSCTPTYICAPRSCFPAPLYY